jgi:hypothetical protein
MSQNAVLPGLPPPDDSATSEGGSDQAYVYRHSDNI